MLTHLCSHVRISSEDAALRPAACTRLPPFGSGRQRPSTVEKTLTQNLPKTQCVRSEDDCIIHQRGREMPNERPFWVSRQATRIESTLLYSPGEREREVLSVNKQRRVLWDQSAHIFNNYQAEGPISNLPGTPMVMPCHLDG